MLLYKKINLVVSKIVLSLTYQNQTIMARTIDSIITKVNCKYGAPMGRYGTGTDTPTDKRVFDCAVPMGRDGAYDRGGAYWGIGSQLRVEYTKDLNHVRFYRK